MILKNPIKVSFKHTISDSLYLALSATSLDEVIKPEMQSEWPETKARWFPRSDSPENKAYDKRTPGNLVVIFKVKNK